MTSPIVPSPGWAGEALAEPAPGLLAVWLAAWTTDGGGGERSPPLLFFARGERRAAALAAGARSLAPDLVVLELPAWDTLPDDRLPPSRGVLGARMTTLRWLAAHDGAPCLLVAPVEAAVQLLPPAGAHAEALPTLKVGERPDLDALRAWLLEHGYVVDERVDEPGEAAFRAGVVDLPRRRRPAEPRRARRGRACGLDPRL